MSEISIYTVSPRQAKTLTIDAIECDTVPYLHSSPGMGKSSIMRDVCNHFNLHMIDHRMSTSVPEDLTGLPRFNERNRAEFVAFEDLFPIRGDTIPEGKDGWMIFLDEFPAAIKQVQAASFKLILDKMVGQKNLHENVVISAAGNLMSDKSIVNPLSTAMQSRVIHLEMRVDYDEWLEDVALTHSYDTRIIAFLAQYPAKLMDFNPNHNNKTFCCPRTWEFMNRFLKGNKPADASRVALFAGTITSAVAAEFVQFCRVYTDMVTLEQVMTNPTTLALPSSTDLKWATITSLAEKATERNLDKISEYIERFSVDFKILFYRMVFFNPALKLRDHPVFRKAMIEMNKYLKY